MCDRIPKRRAGGPSRMRAAHHMSQGSNPLEEVKCGLKATFLLFLVHTTMKHSMSCFQT